MTTATDPVHAAYLRTRDTPSPGPVSIAAADVRRSVRFALDGALRRGLPPRTEGITAAVDALTDHVVGVLSGSLAVEQARLLTEGKTLAEAAAGALGAVATAVSDRQPETLPVKALTTNNSPFIAEIIAAVEQGDPEHPDVEDFVEMLAGGARWRIEVTAAVAALLVEFGLQVALTGWVVSGLARPDAVLRRRLDDPARPSAAESPEASIGSVVDLVELVGMLRRGDLDPDL